LFATDGLHELRNHWDEDFGWSELGELWTACSLKSADESVELVLNGARTFSMHTEQSDDITAIALKVPAALGENASEPVPAPANQELRREESNADVPFPSVPVTPW